MAKTRPIGVRFDDNLTEHLKQVYKIETPQQVLNFLSDFYYDTINDTAIYWHFYKLINPLDNSVFYIGRTKRPIRFRLSGHISEATNKATFHLQKSLIIRAILDTGKKPLIVLLEKIKITHPDDELKIAGREFFWIEKYAAQGSPLTNDSPSNFQKPLELPADYVEVSKVSTIDENGVVKPLTFPKPSKKGKAAPKTADLENPVETVAPTPEVYNGPKMPKTLDELKSICPKNLTGINRAIWLNENKEKYNL